MIRVGILGASGYGGGELLRLLSAHPDVEAVQGASRSKAGQPIGSAHPNLRGLLDSHFVAEIAMDWLAEAEIAVLFSAMPHGELGKRHGELSLPDTVTIIDLSADFRISDPELYELHYGSRPSSSAAGWVYGLPEWRKPEIAGARRIANPGCFATALELALLPLASLSVEPFLAASGATGSSGSGMTPSETTHHPSRSNDFRAYKVLNHQHMAEVTQLLSGLGRSDLDVSFVPHSAPMVRGILVTLQARLTADEDVRAVYESYYGHEPFVRVVEGSPRVAAVVGSNFADIGVVQNGRQVAVMVAIDNLMKGMAGQAVQNMNIALGLDETAGLWFGGGYPY